MTSRRAFLSGAGALGLAGLVAACGGGDGAAPTPPPGTTPPGTPSTTPTTTAGAAAWSGDGQAVALCAALSGLAAAIYTDAANAGPARFGAVPGAVSALLAAAATQHTANVAAWNQVLTAAGRPEVTDDVGLTVEPRLRQRLDAARAPVDLLSLVLDLETATAATVTSVLGEITEPAAITVAAGVAPVASMRAATASFLLGRPAAAPGDPVAGALGRDALGA